MVIVAFIVLIGFAIVGVFIVGVVLAVVSLIRSVVRAVRPRPASRSDPSAGTSVGAETFEVDPTDAAFDAIVAREWPER